MHCGHIGSSVAWIYVNIREFKFCSFLDTGSVVSIVREMVTILAIKIGAVDNYLDIDVSLKGVSSEFIRCKKAIKLSIITNARTIQMPFVIAPDDFISACFLLRMNYLVKGEATLDFSEAVISYGDYSEKLRDEWLTIVQPFNSELEIEPIIDDLIIYSLLRLENILNLQNRSEGIRKLRENVKTKKHS